MARPEKRKARKDYPNEGIKAGEFGIPAHLSQSDILKLLQGGKTLQRCCPLQSCGRSLAVRSPQMLSGTHQDAPESGSDSGRP